MKFTPTDIADVILVEPQAFTDDRGFFMETWHAQKFAAGGVETEFVQDNHSRSCAGALRGLHYQLQNSQGKLVRAVVGAVFDVAVDLRRSSKTFGRWEGRMLSASNRHQLWIPPGFAHGFYVTTEVAEVVYKCTDYYAPTWERTIRFDDPQLGIDWPLIKGVAPLLSQKDAAGQLLHEADCFA